MRHLIATLLTLLAIVGGLFSMWVLLQADLYDHTQWRN